MKRSKAQVALRRDGIVRFLEEHHESSITELANIFQVSPLTIRRDIELLEKRQFVEKGHGTVAISNPLGRPSGSRRILSNKAIGKAAASLVEDGECIFINASSSALNVIPYIKARDVTVVTNNGKALTLNDLNNISLILIGGEIRPPQTSITGELALDFIRKVNATKCFIGVAGISNQYGLTSSTAPEPIVNHLMIERSKTRVVVADSSKIERVSSFQFGDISDVDILVTDTGIIDSQIAHFKQSGVSQIIRVNPTEPDFTSNI